MTAGILLLEDEALARKKQDFAQNSVLRSWKINFLDLKEADF